MTFIRPIPRAITRPFSVLIVAGWVASMAALLDRAYLRASANLATDLARYGSDAQWQGVYYRGEKIGFTVRQTLVRDRGYELQEEGRLRMSLLGATTWTRVRTVAQVDEEFRLQRFEFSLDPGTGATEIRGDIRDGLLRLTVVTAGGTRTDQLELAEAPVLATSIGRRLASAGLQPGAVHRWMVFDPSTLRNAPLVVRVGERGLVRTGTARSRLPAFRVEMEFAGLRVTSWITDTGEVVREESPLGLVTVREPPELARALAVTPRAHADLLADTAVVPRGRERISEARDVRRVRLALSGADLSGLEIDGLTPTATGAVVDLRDPRFLGAGPADPAAASYLAAERFVESDDPAIREEAERAVANVVGDRARAERLVRHVHDLLEKRPTVSLPSAREVLRTRTGDCNEHTVLYVALARAIGIPARTAVGLAFTRGAFYYHAWPEVYLDEGGGRGRWLPVDPTFNQFPADAMHLRLARGGLEQQAAILPLIGRLQIAILDVELDPNVKQVIVGQQPDAAAPPVIALPQPSSARCWDNGPPAVREDRRR
ncbi:MAG TPA: transglutaminase-like domain-containing protein [Vicinamibacterales bacterium]|nr:transglutaminase-like domain-containing protein [Vicinamibacterales bacterium]